jgi:hypothetical protein
MNATIIAGLTGLGVASIAGEKILNCLGKSEMGQYVSIAGYTQLAISAISGVVKLISVIANIG